MHIVTLLRHSLYKKMVDNTNSTLMRSHAYAKGTRKNFFHRKSSNISVETRQRQDAYPNVWQKN
jgi:hypothetical protein